MTSLHWLFITASFACSYSQAAVTINIAESGADVVATATGTLDTSGLTGGDATVFSLMQYVNASSYAYLIGLGGGNSATVYPTTFGTAQPLQSVAIDELADSSSGGPVGVDASGGSVRLYVPNGYTSGAPINATSTWTNTTFAGLNLTPGSYVFDYGTDRITFTVGDAVVVPTEAAPVPLMPTWMQGLMAFGLLTLAMRSFRRRRNV